MKIKKKGVFVNIEPEIVESVKGFLDPEEGRALYDLALDASKRGPCLEIGSYCGKSALYLGAACKENQTVLFSIDHHKGSEEQQPGEGYFDPELFNFKSFEMDTLPFFRTAIEKAGLTESVIPMVCRSDVAARSWATPLSLVFIDGGHAYDTVYTDYNCWASHVMPGGFLLIHDIFKNPEQGGQAPFEIYKLAQASGLFKALPMVKTLGVLQRNFAF